MRAAGYLVGDQQVAARGVGEALRVHAHRLVAAARENPPRTKTHAAQNKKGQHEGTVVY